MKLPVLTSSQEYRMVVSGTFIIAILCLLLFTGHSWERNSVIDLFFEFAGLIFIMVCTFGRLWAAVYASGYKDEKIVDVGPYSVVRNPLYLFSFIGTIGIGFASENVLVLLGGIDVLDLLSFRRES